MYVYVRVCVSPNVKIYKTCPISFKYQVIRMQMKSFQQAFIIELLRSDWFIFLNYIDTFFSQYHSVVGKRLNKYEYCISLGTH